MKMNALNDTKNPGTVKICGRKRGIFVIVCGICRGMDKKQIFKWHNWPKKPRKCYTKIKPVLRQGCGVRSTGATAHNESSSRSHAVFRLHLYRDNGNGDRHEAVMSLVDLAGSESVRKTQVLENNMGISRPFGTDRSRAKSVISAKSVWCIF